MATVLEIALPGVCKFCGQTLADRDAVRHYEEAMARFADQVAREAEQEAFERGRREASTTLEAEMKRFRALQARQKTMLSRVRSAERAKLERKYADREKRHETTIRLLKQNNAQLERRVDKLSAPERGEIGEDDLFSVLTRTFPEDKIELHGRGGDIVQNVVVSDLKKTAGVIVYECKATLKWSNAFVKQARAAGQKHSTSYVMLVTTAFPSRERGQVFVREGVVVVQPVVAPHIADVLRRAVLATHDARLTAEESTAKTERLYDYLAGHDFGQTIAALTDAADSARKLLHAEQRAHERDWERREEVYGQVARRTSALDERVRTIITGCA